MIPYEYFCRIVAVACGLLLIAFFFAAPAKADTLIIQRPWSSSTFNCSEIVTNWVGDGGGVRAICHSVSHTHDADHILNSGFDETHWGPWWYTVRGDVQDERSGCAMAFSSPTNVMMICNQGQ